MRSFLVLLTFLACRAYAFGQNNWETYTQKDGIVFRVKDFTCTYSAGKPIDYKIIEIKNPTAHRVKVSYRLEALLPGQVAGPDTPEYTSEIILEAGQSLSGSCDRTLPARLEILVQNHNLADPPITRFDIKNISVSWLD